MSAGAARNAAIRELRLHLCQKSAASQGVRDFVTKHYATVKAANPSLPILVRECSGITPKIWARYPYGQETVQDLTNKNADQVLAAVKSLVK